MKPTKGQNHDIFMAHINHNFFSIKTNRQCMKTLDSCQGLPSQPEHRSKHLPATQYVDKKKIFQKHNTHQTSNYMN